MALYQASRFGRSVHGRADARCAFGPLGALHGPLQIRQLLVDHRLMSQIQHQMDAGWLGQPAYEPASFRHPVSDCVHDSGGTLLPPPRHPDDNQVTREEMKRCLPIFLQSSVLGTAIGALPGTGSTTAAYLCYGAAQRRSHEPEKFGHGSIEGVAAAEAGNNAVCGGALIPMLMQFLVGRVAIVVFRRLADMPQAIIMPIVMVIYVIGAYSTNYAMTDIWVMLAFGAAGYVMNKLEIPLAPFIIAFVLGPQWEQSLRLALMLSRGDFSVFVTHPISLGFLVLTALFVASVARRTWRRQELVG